VRNNVGVSAIAVAVLVCTLSAGASADRVSWDVVSSGGITGSVSGSYKLWGSVGQTGVDMLTGVTYRVYSGFWNPWLIGMVEAEDGVSLGRPTTYQLGQNYPNPFNAGTTVRYALPTAGRVLVEIFNLRGQRVRVLADATLEAGYHFARWDGKNVYGQDVGSGVYLCRMTARGPAGSCFEHSREMLLVR
jgi:hypothetical protein